MSTLDPVQKKKALRQLTYGIYVVTACSGERYAAGTVTWLSQSSFNPPLVMVGIQRESSLHQVITASRAFVVHVVGKDQRRLADQFIRAAVPEGNTLRGFEFEPGVTGAPVLADPPAWFECRVVEETQRGDHTVFLAEVVAAGVRREEEPLTLRDTGFAYGG